MSGEQDIQDKIYKSALKEKAEIIKSLEPLRKEETPAVEKVNKAKAELKAIRDKIVEIEAPRLAECSRIIATLAPNQKKLSKGR